MFNNVIEDESKDGATCHKSNQLIQFQKEFLVMQKAILDLEYRVEELEFARKELEMQIFASMEIIE